MQYRYISLSHSRSPPIPSARSLSLFYLQARRLVSSSGRLFLSLVSSHLSLSLRLVQHHCIPYFSEVPSRLEVPAVLFFFSFFLFLFFSRFLSLKSHYYIVVSSISVHTVPLAIACLYLPHSSGFGPSLLSLSCCHYRYLGPWLPCILVETIEEHHWIGRVLRFRFLFLVIDLPLDPEMLATGGQRLGMSNS